MKRSWVFLVSVSLTLSLAVPLLYGGLESLKRLNSLPWWGFATLLSMVCGAWLCNAARMRILVAGLGARLSGPAAVGTVISAEFAGVATPASTGWAATYILLLRRSGLRVGHGAAVVAVDQLTDLLFFATAVPLALALLAFRGGISHPPGLLMLSLGLVLGGVALMAVTLRHYRVVVRLIGRFMKRVPRLRGVRYRVARWLVQFRASIRLLLTMGWARLFALYLLCVAHWMLRYGVLPVLLWFMRESVPWSYLFLAQGLMLFAGHLTFLPGGGGGVEVSFGALLRPYLDPVTLTVAVLLWRFFTFYWYLIAGAPIFMLTTGGRWPTRLLSRRAP